MREMKNSGIEWIGDIPSKWGKGRIKDVLSVLTDYTANGSFADLAKNVTYLDYDGYARLVRLTDLRDDLKNEDGVFVSEYSYNYLSKSSLYGDEVLVANVGAYAGLFCLMPMGKGLCTLGPNMFLLRPNNEMTPKFLFYMGQSNAVWEQLRLKSTATAQPKLNKTDVKNIYICIPNITEQNKICSVLDEKCDEIDALVTDIHSEIETLEAYKRSVITEAVTKGLDKNVPMKDSGIEWIGSIPSSWSVQRGKYVFEQKTDKGNSISLVLLSPTQNYGVIPQELYEELSGFSAVKLNEKTDLNSLKTVHKGAFVISLRSFQGGFEYSEYEGVVSPAYQVFYPTIPICDGYYKYLFKTQIFIDKMNSYTMSLRDGKNIAFADFGRTYIPIPPVDEQKRIAKTLDEISKDIGFAIDKKNEQIEVLSQYKKSIIYEYVTGKKEVG